MNKWIDEGSEIRIKTTKFKATGKYYNDVKLTDWASHCYLYWMKLGEKRKQLHQRYIHRQMINGYTYLLERRGLPDTSRERKESHRETRCCNIGILWNNTEYQIKLAFFLLDIWLKGLSINKSVPFRGFMHSYCVCRYSVF